MDRRLLTAKRAARYLGLEATTFNRWRRDQYSPRLPVPVETRGRAMYVREELDAFVDELKSLRGSPAR